jgi:hemerythrin superfamily protein
MKYFPFKILILCILMPPLLYIASVQMLEKKLQSLYSNEIEEIYIGDTRPLFQGSLTITDAITRNIDSYIQSKALLSWGVKASVTVTTPTNTIIYPDTFSQQETADTSNPPMQIAKENYAALNEGFTVVVDVQIESDQFISYAVLALFVFLSLLVFLFFYRRGSRIAEGEASRVRDEIQRLSQMEQTQQARLNTLNEQRKYLSDELHKTRKIFDSEKEKASRTEDEMIDEIVTFEKKMEENLFLQKEQEKEINALKEKISHYEKGALKPNKQKTKASEAIQKRFKTLYKNLLVHDRAVSGFISLTPELQLKAEELMLQLHDDPKQVPIKRKVFGKKNREAVFEVLFSYKGRLYYRHTREQKLEVVSIGTKHTQGKDLTFLDQL